MVQSVPGLQEGSGVTCIRDDCVRDAGWSGYCVMHTPEKMKARAVGAYVNGDETVAETASRYGVAERTIYRWAKRAGARKGLRRAA